MGAWLPQSKHCKLSCAPQLVTMKQGERSGTGDQIPSINQRAPATLSHVEIRWLLGWASVALYMRAES